MSGAPFELAGKRIWVAGHRGMLGAALCRRLGREDCAVLTVPREALDLREQAAVFRWMEAERPDAVFLAAARVGGIEANRTRPAEFLYDNLMIAANVVEGARRAGVAKLLMVGSTAVYPPDAAQPYREDAILTGPLDPTHQWYAVAKIAGVKLAEAYHGQYGLDVVTALPTNLYGPGDSFDAAASHVVPALIAKAHAAKLAGAEGMEIWGTGTPRRELLHVDDCADALVHLMVHQRGPEPVNVGTGEDIAIVDLARMIMGIIGLEGPLRHDLAKPDGVARKLTDCARLHALGWCASIPLETGLTETYRAYLAGLGRGIAAS